MAEPGKHFNIQINIQEVTEAYTDTLGRRAPVTGEQPKIPKDSKEVLTVKVVAATLEEAVRKASAIMQVSLPPSETVIRNGTGDLVDTSVNSRPR